MSMKPTLFDRIVEKQLEDPFLSTTKFQYEENPFLSTTKFQEKFMKLMLVLTLYICVEIR